MAQVPSFKKILRAKFPQDLKWIPLLLGPLNSFMEDVQLGLNKRLNITQNFDGEVKSIKLDGTYPIKLAWGRDSKPTIGFIGSIAMLDGSDVTLAGAVFPLWEFNQQGNIQINQIVGLSDDAADKKYNITMIFLVE